MFEHWFEAKTLLINYHTENQINMKWKSVIDRELRWAVLYVEYICGLFENRSPNSFETDIITIPKYTVENVQFLWMAKNRVDFWSSKFMLNLSNSMVGRSSHHKVQVCTQQNSRKTRFIC